MNLKTSLAALLLAALFLAPSSFAEPLDPGAPRGAKEERIKELRELIAFNGLKSRDVQAAGSSREDLSKAIREKLDILKKTTLYSIELAELTIEDPAALEQRKTKLLADLVNLEMKAAKFMQTPTSNKDNGRD